MEVVAYRSGRPPLLAFALAAAGDAAAGEAAAGDAAAAGAAAAGAASALLPLLFKLMPSERRVLFKRRRGVQRAEALPGSCVGARLPPSAWLVLSPSPALALAHTSLDRPGAGSCAGRSRQR